MQPSFGEHLRYYIKRSEYQQKELAQWLDVDPSTLSRWIRGKRPIQYADLKRICDRLEMSAKEVKDLFELAELLEPRQNNRLLVSSSGRDLRQREEEYLTRLSTRPDFHQWAAILYTSFGWLLPF